MDEGNSEPPTKKRRRLEPPQTPAAAPDDQVHIKAETESNRNASPKQAASPPPMPSQGITEVVVHQAADEDDDCEPVQVKYEVVEEVVPYESCAATGVIAGIAADDDQQENGSDNAASSPALVPTIVSVAVVEDDDAATTPSGSPELAELRVEWPVSPSQAAVVVGATHAEALPEMYALDPMAQPTPEQLAVVGGPDHMPCDYRMMTLNQGSPGHEFQELPPHHHGQAQPYLLASPGGYSVRILPDDGEPPQHVKLVKSGGARGTVVVDSTGSEVVHGEVFIPSGVEVVPRTTAYGHHTGVIAAPVTTVLSSTAAGPAFLSRDTQVIFRGHSPNRNDTDAISQVRLVLSKR
ncbi:hypothetical protein V5799_018500 [Amblyomma americanum]|uniref:Uncharacterized protein n=1 Tax=Amblyomma americanum TaxID=6943 RepID=A0AAQ4EZI9_AMBAM